MCAVTPVAYLPLPARTYRYIFVSMPEVAQLSAEPSGHLVAAWRADTPGCCSAEGGDLAHLNNAGAALVPAAVHGAVVGHLERELLQGGYEAATAASAATRGVYESIAALINAESPDTIALVESATVAWDSFFYALPWRPGDVVLTTSVEYGANYVAYLHLAQKFLLEVRRLPNASDGAVDPSQVRAALEACNGRCRLVAVTHVPTNGGLVQPAEAIGAAIADFNAAHCPTSSSTDDHGGAASSSADCYRVHYLLDACQSVGQLPVDVQALRCDALSATSRKYLRGPRGAGFLYVRLAALPPLLPPTIDHHAATWVAVDRYELHGTARRFEKWEASAALRLGLGAAVDYARRIGIDVIWTRVRWLAAYLRRGLASIAEVSLADLGTVKCGIVTFTVQGWPAADLQRALATAQPDGRRFNTTVSTDGATRVDMESRGLKAINRASVHYYNTTHECDALIDAIRRVAQQAPPPSATS